MLCEQFYDGDDTKIPAEKAATTLDWKRFGDGSRHDSADDVWRIHDKNKNLWKLVSNNDFSGFYRDHLGLWREFTPEFGHFNKVIKIYRHRHDIEL